MIKMFLCDCDGVLTDGIYTVSNNYFLSKNFHTRDFHGLRNLLDIGMDVAIITSSDDGIIDQRLRGAGLWEDIAIYNSHDKCGTVNEEVISDGTLWGEIAYMGDDVMDIELLKKVGIAACPADAHPTIIELVKGLDDGFVSKFNGGKGAVREFADYICVLKENIDG